MSTQPQRRILRMPEVRQMVGLGKTAIYDRIKAHTFPGPIKMGRASGWVEEEIQQWLDEQILATRGGH